MIAISISAMLGSGIFVLPGLAAYKAGPWVWLAYLVAGITVLPAALSKSELGTAMPTSGGTYVYLDRTFGPLAGTISGLGLWLTMLLKSAFALVGFSAYLAVLEISFLENVSTEAMALSLLVVITMLNILGVSIISKMQKFIVSGVLLLLLGLAFTGLQSMDFGDMKHGFTWHGKTGTDYWLHSFLAGTAFVYVSYAGVTKIAAIAEEVKDPDRNLPLGILISWLLIMCIYVFVVLVLVTNVPLDDLAGEHSKSPDLHPISTLATILLGKTAGTVAAVLAVITMVSMAVAGLLAASRFPFAMSRDQLLPSAIQSINPSFKTPVISILLTAFVMMLTILFLDVADIAKLASAFMILAFMFVCGTVIVLRENAAQWYQPRFRSPWYPFTQIFGVVSGIVLLVAMGWTSLLAIGCIVLFGAVSYFGYGQHKTSRRGVVGKMGKRPDLFENSGPATLNEELPTDAAVVVPLFGSERSPETLVEMGASLAHGRRLEVLHVTAVPEQIFLADALEEDQQSESLSRRIHAMAEEENVLMEYDKTVSRDVVDTIYQVAGRLDCEWVVMEAAGRRRFGISFQNPLGWLQDHLPCNLAVFKDAGVRYIRQILVYVEPGPHDSLVVATADHLAEIYKAELNFICFVDDTMDLHSNQARGDYIDQLRDLCVSPTKAIALHGTNEQQTILDATAGYDLMIMGAAPNRTLKGRLFGTPTDELTRSAQCSVLWLKTQAVPTLQTFDVEHMSVESEFDLCQYLSPSSVRANVTSDRKEQLFKIATQLIVDQNPKSSPLVVSSALWEREQLQNTFVGDGVAMPHATLVGAQESMIAVLTAAKPIEYGDKGETANVFFFTTGSPNARQTHLKILAELSRLSIHTDFLKRVPDVRSDHDLYQLLVDCLKK